MNGGIIEVSYQGLVYAFLPALIVLAIMWRWRGEVGTAVHAMLRMLVQLFIVGYVLVYIFESDNFWIILAVVSVMIFVASWIAIRPLGADKKRSWPFARPASITSISTPPPTSAWPSSGSRGTRRTRSQSTASA